LCDWLAACGQLLGPLYDLLRTEMLLSQVLHTDCTFRHCLSSGHEADHAAPEFLDFSRHRSGRRSCLKFVLQTVSA
jgi:hypothetical protein